MDEDTAYIENFSSAKPTRTTYRSLTSDGKVWCESSDPRDVRERKKDGEKLMYEKIEVYEVTAGWEPWAS